MALEILRLESKLVRTITSVNGTNTVSLLDYVPYARTGYRIISESLTIESLKATSWIYSLDPVPFPTFELEDDESKRLLTALNLEWNSPRYELNLLIQINNDEEWHSLVTLSLLNASPYPFREYELGTHKLGDNSALGVQLRDVGFGQLQENDRVTFQGDLIRNIILEKLVDTSTKIANAISSIAATIINGNPDRTGLTLFNSSDKDIFVDTSSDVSTTSYMIKLQPGDYYEAPSPIYTGAYWAKVATGSTAIDIREFV